MVRFGSGFHVFHDEIYQHPVTFLSVLGDFVVRSQLVSFRAAKDGTGRGVSFVRRNSLAVIGCAAGGISGRRRKRDPPVLAFGVVLMDDPAGRGAMEDPACREVFSGNDCLCAMNGRKSGRV
jgi:hypothetical protein